MRLTASRLPFTSAEGGGGFPLAPAARASHGQRLLSLRANAVPWRPQCVRSNFDNRIFLPRPPTF